MAKMPLPVVALFTLFTALAAHAQWATGPAYAAPPHFDHIIFIIQENRTPDTLFGGAPIVTNPACAGFNGFANGVDLQNGGPNKVTSTCTPLASYPNLGFGGGSHAHSDWEDQYDNGALDGACVAGTGANCISVPYAPYISVQQSVVQPYLSIAANYAWANYFFQTNQGPSFPAHQFLFSGTSAPTWPTTEYSRYFISENPGFLTAGCDGTAATGLNWIEPIGTEASVKTLFPKPSGFLQEGYICYDRNTLVTSSTTNTSAVSDRTTTGGSAITWKYYSQQAGIIWNAPEAITQTCNSQNAILPNSSNTAPAACGTNGTEYSHVSLPQANVTGAPILTDIQKCNLQQISWVTPDGVWSDHPGASFVDPTNPNLGPSWVALIVDAIGQSAQNGCDYWTKEPTAIFILWDDWGGYYDHVPPPAVNVGTGTPPDHFKCTNSQGGSWGCGYTYGFRVPLMVVSPYTKPGTVSGALSSNTLPTLAQYANLPKAWTHDFGSLLKFTEENFYPKGTQIAPKGYTYADSNTFDTSYNGATVVPMWEFFNSPTVLPFTPITPGTNPTTGQPYINSFFENYYVTQDQVTGAAHKPTDADDDGDEE